MIANEEILQAYALAAKDAPGHPQSLGSPPRVMKIDVHWFIFSEIWSKDRSFDLLLGEALPAIERDDPPTILLQSRSQILAQVRDFVESREVETG